jgi:hypothetical protein
MKIKFIILFGIIFFTFGCNKQRGNLKIVFERKEKLAPLSFRVNGLILKNMDSIFFEHDKTFLSYTSKDTFRVEKLPFGNYKLQYVNILGELITRDLDFKKHNSVLLITVDSINIEKYQNSIPINNLKNNENYSVDMVGGCVAGFYGYYSISKKNNQYHFKSADFEINELDSIELSYLKQFESELFAINKKDICESSGRTEFKIVKNDNETKIIDNTCNWNGWGNLFLKLRNKN